MPSAARGRRAPHPYRSKDLPNHANDHVSPVAPIRWEQRTALGYLRMPHQGGGAGESEQPNSWVRLSYLSLLLGGHDSSDFVRGRVQDHFERWSSHPFDLVPKDQAQRLGSVLELVEHSSAVLG